MPVEIKELVIRAVASDDQSAGRDASDAPPDAADREAIVEDCVRRVMQILKTKQER